MIRPENLAKIVILPTRRKPAYYDTVGASPSSNRVQHGTAFTRTRFEQSEIQLAAYGDELYLIVVPRGRHVHSGLTVDKGLLVS